MNRCCLFLGRNDSLLLLICLSFQQPSVLINLLLQPWLKLQQHAVVVLQLLQRGLHVLQLCLQSGDDRLVLAELNRVLRVDLRDILLQALNLKDRQGKYEEGRHFNLII